MFTRRQFGVGLSALALTTAGGLHRARAAVPNMRWANASGFASPQLTNGTVGLHPKLGFYRQEGINMEVLNMTGSATTMQSVLAGNCEFASLSPISYLPLIAKNPSLDLTVPFVWLRQIHTQIYVLPDSPYKQISDLRGKNIGYVNPSDTSYSMAQQMFKEIGFDVDRDVRATSVGQGVPAGKALVDGRVDALGSNDTDVARLEIAGYKLRGLPNVGTVAKLFGLAWGVRRSALKKDRKSYVGLFRGMAKSTIFTHANPELATRLHYELFPEALPTGVSLDEAVKQAQQVLDSRKDKWLAPKDPNADPRIGGQTIEDWKAWLRFTQLEDKVKDASALFTNELLDEVNDFDQEAIRKMAMQG